MLYRLRHNLQYLEEFYSRNPEIYHDCHIKLDNRFQVNALISHGAGAFESIFKVK